MTELEELRLAYAECSRQRNDLLNKLKHQAQRQARSADTWVNATTWRGLTIEDKKEYIAQDFGGSRTDAMDWTEKRLMEKNNGN